MVDISSVTIYTGEPDRPYTPIKPIKVRITSATVFSRTRTFDEVNDKLRVAAAKLGGNAVIGVEYERGISITSWKALTAVGLVVQIESDETNCPFCAEVVKLDARVCKHCGSDLPSAPPPPPPPPLG